MTFSEIERLFSRPAVRLAGAWFAGAIVLAAATNASADPAMRKASPPAKAYGQAVPTSMQQQKPVRLRYFGGPKSPIFAE
jgi:hypothetical protein